MPRSCAPQSAASCVAGHSPPPRAPGGDVWEDGKDGRPAKRSLRDIALDEVAVLTITPAYIATTVDAAKTRSEDGAALVCTEVRSLEDPAEKTENTETRAQDRARLELMKLEV